MRYLRSVVDGLDSLESGDTFRRYFSFGLKFSGVLILSVSILAGFALLYFLRETPGLITGAILSTVIIIHFGIVGIMVYWNRADKITALGQESHLTFAPIVGVTVRLTGEISCLFFIMLGTLAFVCSVFMPAGYFPIYGIGIPGDTALFASIMVGLLLCFLCVFIAVFLLVFFYVTAEYASLIGDLATNTKKIETILSSTETHSVSDEEISLEEEE